MFIILLGSRTMVKTACVFIIVGLLMVACFGGSCNGESGGDDNESVVVVAAPMEREEQEALYSTIQGFVGKWWNGSDLYPDPCGWTPIQGVSCDLFNGLWYVTELNIGPIHDNSLECAPNVELTPHLFSLNHLKSLSFFNCFVSPLDHPITLPLEAWKSLSTSLESLEFRSNPGLTGPIPPSLGRLQALQSLVLIENGFTGQVPLEIGNLVNLRRLVVSGNGFSGPIPETLGGLGNLLILDMSRNAISGPLPSTLGGLTSLLKLDLSKNQLQGEIPDRFGNLKNLTLLDLSNNGFSFQLGSPIQEMTSLEELVLSNNPMGGDLNTIQFQQLTRLTTLDLANTSLTGVIPGRSVSSLKSLRFLGLSDNKLTGEVSSSLAELPNVSAIYINGNNLTGVLNFSQQFYGRLGRRFGAWRNPNLCYPIGLVRNREPPYGVKPCHQETRLYQTNSEKNKSWNHHNSNSYCSHHHDGVWYISLIVVAVLVCLNNFGL